MSDAIDWSVPPVVKQNNECSCWAAALEAWIKSAARQITLLKNDVFGMKPEEVTQTYLINRYATHDKKNAFTCNGALDANLQKKFSELIAPEAGMRMFVVKDKFLLSTNVEIWLREGPLYLVYQKENAKFSHVVVCYASYDDPDTDEMVLKVMDPGPSKGLGERPLSFWDKCKLQVGFPHTGFLGWYPGRPDVLNLN